MHTMSDSDIKELKRDRSRSPVGGADEDRDRGRRMDRKTPRKTGTGRRAPPSHRVYVSNIPYEYKWQDLKDLFRNEVGEVNYVEMFKDDTGRPRGCGIIEFETAELAQKGIDQMHRYELAGRKLVVKEDFDLDRDSQGRIRKEISRMANNSAGSNFTAGASRMGNANNMGSGPVNYGNTYGLSLVFLESLGITGPLVNKVFVANLDYSVDENQLREVFKVAGKVMNAEITKDQETNKSRGFGVVEYEHPVEAVQAISMLNGQLYYDRKLSVRMDRVQDNKKGDTSAGSKLPAGLKGLGMGLGLNGSALVDVSIGGLSIIQSNQNNHGPGLSTNTAPANNLPANMGANLPIGGMGGNNMSNMGQSGMGLMNPLATNMSNNMPNNMGMGQNMPGMGGGGGMGNMGSGLMGMGGSNTGMDNNMSSNMMGSSSMLSSGMMGNSAAIGQVAGMNRLGSGFGNFNNTTDIATNRNFSGNFGNSGGGGGGGGIVSGNVLQISNLPLETTWQNLRDLCREYGEIRFAEIRTKGTGTVKFHSESDARRAVDMLDRQRFSGRVLEARVI